MNNYQLDARRLLCPMPVIRVQNQVKEMQVGDILEIVCTDPGVLHDIPAWCRVHGHEVLTMEQNGREIVVKIMVKDGSSNPL